MTVNAPPASEAMRPQRVASYCQRSPTKSSFVFEICSLASLFLFMFHMFFSFWWLLASLPRIPPWMKLHRLPWGAV